MNPLTTLRDGYRWLVDPYGYLDDALARRGLTFHAKLPVLGDVLMTGDPKWIADIVPHPQLDGGKAVTGLRAIFGGRSLIMLEGEVHAARRRLIAPSFRGEGLVEHDALTVRVTRDTFISLPTGRTFCVYDVLRRIGLRVMVAAMFGSNNAILPQAEKVVDRFLASFRNPLILFFKPLRIDAGPWSPWGRAVRNRSVLCDLIRGQIRSNDYRRGENGILGRLVAEGGSSLQEEDLVEEVMSLLLFGHDTAAATMAWAFVHLFGNQGIKERIREEVGDEDGPLDPDAMRFTKACLLESMRLCPVVVHLSRTAAADLRLGEFEIRKGQKIIPCIYMAQHNPSVFPEPHRFRPERFLAGKRYEYSFFPFGFGNRTCVGKPFAMRQMQLVVATAARCVDLDLAPGYRPKPARHLVLIVPKGGGLFRRRALLRNKTLVGSR